MLDVDVKGVRKSTAKPLPLKRLTLDVHVKGVRKSTAKSFPLKRLTADSTHSHTVTGLICTNKIFADQDPYGGKKFTPLKLTRTADCIQRTVQKGSTRIRVPILNVATRRRVRRLIKVGWVRWLGIKTANHFWVIHFWCEEWNSCSKHRLEIGNVRSSQILSEKNCKGTTEIFKKIINQSTGRTINQSINPSISQSIKRIIEPTHNVYWVENSVQWDTVSPSIRLHSSGSARGPRKK